MAHHTGKNEREIKMASGPVRAAGFIIYRHLKGDIQYLLLQTSYGQYHWTPPKGHVDPGEDEYQTAVRETEEEAGLKAEDLRVHREFENTLSYQVKGSPKTVVYWLAEIKDSQTPVTLSDEHSNYKWVALQDACALAKYKDLQQLLKQAEDFLRNSQK